MKCERESESGGRRGEIHSSDESDSNTGYSGISPPTLCWLCWLCWLLLRALHAAPSGPCGNCQGLFLPSPTPASQKVRLLNFDSASFPPSVSQPHCGVGPSCRLYPRIDNRVQYTLSWLEFHLHTRALELSLVQALSQLAH